MRAAAFDDAMRKMLAPYADADGCVTYGASSTLAYGRPS
jgi:hypothetical protein